MDEAFEIAGTDDFIKLTFDEVFGFPQRTCHWGGYETRSKLEVKSADIYMKSSLFVTTGDIFEFTEQLKVCYEKLEGSATFTSCESNLQFTATFDKTGQVHVSGHFQLYTMEKNEFTFNFYTDQSYITKTLEQLETIISKFGDMKGIKN